MIKEQWSVINAKDVSNSVWDTVRCPGLTSSAKEIDNLKEALRRAHNVFRYKRDVPLLWVVFIGGTGTGKSILFNALCGTNISDTGVERPKTQGPVIYYHREKPIYDGFPFSEFSISNKIQGEQTVQNRGSSGTFTVVSHSRDSIAHIAFVDTPDVDSLETRNREMADDFYLLSDVVIFVTSQEKYADEVPSQVFYRVYQDEKPCYFLLNKAGGELTQEEVLTFFAEKHVKISPDTFRLIPYVSSPVSENVSSNRKFQEFASSIFEMFDKTNFSRLYDESRERNRKHLSAKITTLLRLIDEEEEAALHWLDELDVLFEENKEYLLLQLEHHYPASSREFIQNEIRNIFKKYDLLRKPRRYLSTIILTPFRLLGFRRVESRTHARELLNVGKKVDISPILAVIERFNRLVLEKLSPADDKVPLSQKMRNPDLVMTAEEVRTIVAREQENLALWIEENFEEMARSIPKSKEWGIYSTAVLWGIFIISFEIVLGGGIGILEAALDSILAPFVTKGSVELFASREIQKIARELDHRYREGLLYILEEQKKRYRAAALSLVTAPEVKKSIHAIVTELERVV